MAQNSGEATVKRLSPTMDTLRKLYLYSGNQCASPYCSQNILDKDGILFGQICHIEGAMPGSARFNPKMTEKERASFENLVLLCGDCHKAIGDNEKKYTVSDIKKIKSEHERKFRNAVEKIQDSFTDFTEGVAVVRPENLFGDGYTETQEENDKTLKQLNVFIDVLSKIPKKTRSFLAHTLKRYGEKGAVVDNVKQALQIGDVQITSCVGILGEYISCEIEQDNYISNVHHILVKARSVNINGEKVKFDFDMIEYILDIQENKKSDVVKMIESLDFSDLQC